MRDRELDIFRGLVMIYITCVIHVLYWLPIIDTPVKSLSLIEMPVIFFIAGASYKLSSKKSYKRYVIGRIRRVLFPFWGYLIVCFLFYSLLFAVLPNEFRGGILIGNNYSVEPFLARALTLIKGGLPMNFSAYHLWFIAPYFVIAITAPLLTKFIGNARSRFIAFSILLAIFALMDVLSGDMEFKSPAGQSTTIICYLIFYLSGYAFYKNMAARERLIILSVFAIALGIYVVHRINTGTTIDFQNEKFPPTLLFFIYNVVCLILLSLVSRFITHWVYSRNSICKFIDLFSSEGYTIYLYQPFGYIAAYLIFKHYDTQNIIQLPIAILIMLIYNSAIGLISKKLHLSRFLNRKIPN